MARYGMDLKSCIEDVENNGEEMNYLGKGHFEDRKTGSIYISTDSDGWKLVARGEPVKRTNTWELTDGRDIKPVR